MADDRKTGARRWEVGVGKNGDEVEGEEKEKRPRKPKAKGSEDIKKGSQSQKGKHNRRAL